MAQTYAAFLASPSTSHLASDATLNYITTTTSIGEPTAILKHLSAQQKQVTTKEQKVLYSVEGVDSLFLETETKVQFNNGGGAYLPAMDENLLDERIVTFPLLHVVSFDADGKIKQIRLHWDLSTLLKQVEAIGRTGRNWPIRDGKAQVEAISKSLKAQGINTDKQPPLTKGGPNDVVIREHQKRASVSATRDPHASLALFAPRDPNENSSTYEGPKVATRESAKPAPREYNELFANGEAPSPKPGNMRSSSPTKGDPILKSGAGKNYKDNRLFDDDDDSRQPSPERKKTYGQKYNHFDFGDGEDAVQTSRPISNGKASTHQPTFSFEDFATPPKAGNKVRRDDERHWGDEEDPPSPAKRNIVHAARKDADPHFKFTDESSPATERPIHRQKGIGLYRDPLADDDGFTHTKPPSRGTTTNVDNSRRGNDFDKHYQMADKPQDENVAPRKGTNRSDMDQHWSFGTPVAEKKIYKTAGDGMGGRSGAIGTPVAEKKIYKTAGDGDAEVDNRLKRERQTSSGSDDVLIERKTVKVMIVPRPDNALIDEPYGTTKLDCVNIPGGRTYCTRRESLSENDKG